jgi:diguanylate cyclase (GGDEF)-like protein
VTISAAQKLHPIDLLKIYGNIEYDWNLRTDLIDWQGSLLTLVNPEISMSTGSSFCHMLMHADFTNRMKAISEAKDHGNIYKASYKISLPSQEMTSIIEEGEVIYGIDRKPMRLEGYIRFVENDNSTYYNSTQSGYDQITGFPCGELLYESLAASITKATETNTPGAYLAVSIDQLNYINVLHGSDILQEIIKASSEKLRSIIRFNDSIGRLSSSCFGIVLQECDKWGVLQAAQRFIQAVENEPLKTSKGEIGIKVSCGGVSFPDHDLDAQSIMHQAKKYLFDAQSIKGTGISWTPYGHNTSQEMKRDSNAEQGKKRAYDSVQ